MLYCLKKLMVATQVPHHRATINSSPSCGRKCAAPKKPDASLAFFAGRRRNYLICYFKDFAVQIASAKLVKTVDSIRSWDHAAGIPDTGVEGVHNLLRPSAGWLRRWIQLEDRRVRKLLCAYCCAGCCAVEAAVMGGHNCCCKTFVAWKRVIYKLRPRTAGNRGRHHFVEHAKLIRRSCLGEPINMAIRAGEEITVRIGSVTLAREKIQVAEGPSFSGLRRWR